MKQRKIAATLAAADRALEAARIAYETADFYAAQKTAQAKTAACRAAKKALEAAAAAETAAFKDIDPEEAAEDSDLWEAHLSAIHAAEIADCSAKHWRK